jgi:hypothetical protein
MFFFEKKNQKTFDPLRACKPSTARSLLLFFRKEDLPVTQLTEAQPAQS